MQTAKSYVICATPRSGSTLLCDILEATGVAGRPASYFRAESIDQWSRRLGVPISEGMEFDRAYLDAVVREGRGATGTFGLRLMFDSLDGLSGRLDRLFPGLAFDRARLEAAFGPTQFIHLSRTDKVLQAISRLKAMQSGLWHLASDGTDRQRTGPSEEVRYDRGAIGRFVEELTIQDEAWTRWFAANQVEPLRLVYEELSRDPQVALATILSTLGLDPTIATKIEPKTRKLSDLENQRWAARFRDEARSQSGRLLLAAVNPNATSRSPG